MLEEDVYYKVIELFMESHYALEDTDWDSLALELYKLLGRDVPERILDHLDNWTLGQVSSRRTIEIKKSRGWA